MNAVRRNHDIMPRHDIASQPTKKKRDKACLCRENAPLVVISIFSQPGKQAIPPPQGEEQRSCFAGNRPMPCFYRKYTKHLP